MSSFIPPDGQPTHRRPNKWRGSCPRHFRSNRQLTCKRCQPRPQPATRLNPRLVFVDPCLCLWIHLVFSSCAFCVRFVHPLYALCTPFVCPLCGSCVRLVAAISFFAAASHDSTGPSGTKTPATRGASGSVLLVAVIAVTREHKRHYDGNTAPGGD